MLHPKYFKKGSEVDLPEIGSHLPNGGIKFIVEGLHAGGMGLCVHLRQLTTDRHYALKGILPEHLGEKAASDRFFDELRVWLSASMCSLIAEAISIVRIDDTPCVLAAWMKGGDLATALPKLSPAHKFEVLLRILRGLRWVHDNLQVIHRDLKPANVLLDESGLAYVADWGLSRPISHAFADLAGALTTDRIQRPDRTRVGSFLGTVIYAAPEQILNAHGVDFRADIYALGCMMFEFETGQPPFAGKTIQEIAHQHLHAQPPKLGGFFKKTLVGMESIVARCLEKDPSARFSSYAELEQAVLDAATKRQYSLHRCQAFKRYDRSVLGQGREHQERVLANPAVKGTKEYDVVEWSQVSKFLEEASNLMAAGRFREAEQLLSPHFIPALLGSNGEWHMGHVIALDYACCLLNIDGRLAESMPIFEGLSALAGKPSEFYINFGLALLKAGKATDARHVCERGLRRFPEDIALIGNHTIALNHLGDLDAAKESALRRLRIRRDVHAIEEAVSVLRALVTRQRDSNLPDAITNAKSEGQLLFEGLALRPEFHSLTIAQIRLYRFSQAGGPAAELCKTLIERSDVYQSFRELAFYELLDQLAQDKLLESFFNLLKRHEQRLTTPVVKAMVTALKNTVYLDHYMIGHQNDVGERMVLPEVAAFFLSKKDQTYEKPLLASKVLEWLERSTEAVETLDNFLQEFPSHWEGIKTMCLFRVRSDHLREAVGWADYLGTVGPWRAETFDCMSYVYEKTGHSAVARELKEKGNKLFEKEMQLFEDLRKSLGL